jgi:hypothetical protein
MGGLLFGERGAHEKNAPYELTRRRLMLGMAHRSEGGRGTRSYLEYTSNRSYDINGRQVIVQVGHCPAFQPCAKKIDLGHGRTIAQLLCVGPESVS